MIKLLKNITPPHDVPLYKACISFDEIALLHQALSDIIRLAILDLLDTYGELSVVIIKYHMHISPTKLTYHLRMLREAKLIDMHKEGRESIYFVTQLGHIMNWK